MNKTDGKTFLMVYGVNSQARNRIYDCRVATGRAMTGMRDNDTPV